jgi:FkbM family methyltransferase
VRSCLIKRAIQILLKRAHLYGRVKESVIYDLFWRIYNPQLLGERDREIAFYKKTLAGFCQGDLIFDIGANHGAKTAIFLKLGARVVAVDPDETNQKTLKERFLRYRLAEKPVVIIGKAVSDKVGVTRFWIDEPGSAKNTLNQKWVQILREDRERFGERLQFAREAEVGTVTLDDLMATFGTPFFIKIDVEGHEANVVMGLKRPVPFLSFEVNLPEFRAEGVECVVSLDQLSPGGGFNYVINSGSEMASKSWLGDTEIIDVVKDCAEPSIEVFWNSKPGATSGGCS